MKSLSRNYASHISGHLDLRTSVSSECPDGIIPDLMPKLQIGDHHMCKKHRITPPLQVFGFALVLSGCGILQFTPMDIEDHMYPSDMMIPRQTEEYSGLEKSQVIDHSIEGPAFDSLNPNPFNPTTTIRFDLPMDSQVHLIIYDILGREVMRLLDEDRPAGYYELRWNGRDVTGRQVPSGIYIARLLTPEYSKSMKIVKLK